MGWQLRLQSGALGVEDGCFLGGGGEMEKGLEVWMMPGELQLGPGVSGAVLWTMWRLFLVNRACLGPSAA